MSNIADDAEFLVQYRVRSSDGYLSHNRKAHHIGAYIQASLYIRTSQFLCMHARTCLYGNIGRDVYM